MKNCLKPKNTSRTRPAALISREDIFSDLETKKGSLLFLGKYSLPEAGLVLRKKGFIRDAKKQGIWPIKVTIDSSHFPPLQRLQMFYREKQPKNLIVDLKIKETRYTPKIKDSFQLMKKVFSFLVIEWLTLQNPLKRFARKQTPLPGQSFPGLNLGRKVMDLFIYLARLNQNDGILVYPAYFHNALLFSRRFQFLNPEKEAEVRTIAKAFPEISFKQLAWIIHLNCLRILPDKSYEWKAEEQIFPLHRDLRRYLNSQDYEKIVKATLNKDRYSIDWDCFIRKSVEYGVEFASKPD